tara:strand:+ start:157 stop:369 length:213 start_codon:yes stop_codon:yes gene_type:complete
VGEFVSSVQLNGRTTGKHGARQCFAIFGIEVFERPRQYHIVSQVLVPALQHRENTYERRKESGMRYGAPE